MFAVREGRDKTLGKLHGKTAATTRAHYNL